MSHDDTEADPYAGRSLEALLDDADIYAYLKTGGRLEGRGAALLDYLDSTGYVIVKADSLVPDTVPADLCGEAS